MTVTAYEKLKQDIAALMDSFVDDMLADLGSRVLAVCVCVCARARECMHACVRMRGSD
jgi:hypothetical protein